MSKTISAECISGVVTVDGVPIPGAVVLSEGVAQSAGVVVLDEGDAYYLPKTTPDLKTTLDNVVTALNKVVDSITKVGQIFTSVGAGMTGITTAPPPTLATDVTALNAIGTQITGLATTLDTLKGALK